MKTIGRKIDFFCGTVSLKLHKATVYDLFIILNSIQIIPIIIYWNQRNISQRICFFRPLLIHYILTDIFAMKYENFHFFFLTDTGLEKKVRHRTMCPFRGHFALRLFLLFLFFEINSSARISLALKTPQSPVSVNERSLNENSK